MRPAALLESQLTALDEAAFVPSLTVTAVGVIIIIIIVVVVASAAFRLVRSRSHQSLDRTQCVCWSLGAMFISGGGGVQWSGCTQESEKVQEEVGALIFCGDDDDDGAVNSRRFDRGSVHPQPQEDFSSEWRGISVLMPPPPPTNRPPKGNQHKQKSRSNERKKRRRN